MSAKKICIIGGGAGGASCAARARRLDEDARIIVFERGEYVSFANCGLPYYVGNVITKRDKLFIVAPETFRNWFNIEVRVRSSVTSIDRDKKEIVIEDFLSGKSYVEEYDTLVLSPGAVPIVQRHHQRQIG